MTSSDSERQDVTRILLIEDNPYNQELAIDLLDAAGYEVIWAGCGSEGLRLARESSPDLILMDIGLPDIDGLRITRQLRSEEATASTPIVALTAHAMRGDREQALEAGCSGYMCKPIDTRNFVDEVASYLGTQIDERSHA